MSDPTDERSRALSAKSAWHEAQANLPLREKFRILLELQRDEYPLLAARRPLEPWERPWDVEP